METRKDAVAFLHELCSGFPRPLFTKVEESQKGEGFALAYLVQANGEVISGDFAKEMNVSTARIAALLKSMEKKGLVTRHICSADARRTVVRITPAGRERADELRNQLLERIELLLEKVGQEDLDEFIRISHKIKEAMLE